MSHPAQMKIPATYMRGGTSKDVSFRLQDLSPVTQQPGVAHDVLLVCTIGSPDPHGKQINGMGGATLSTSKTVILSKSTHPDRDVDYLSGQVSIDKPSVNQSDNYGNPSAATGPFAINNGLIDTSRIPQNGVTIIRIWQANIGKTIIVYVPITSGAVQETGDFELDGATFPAAEMQLEFLDLAAGEDGDGGGAMLPIGNLVDDLEVPGVDTFKATVANAGTPTIFTNAEAIGYIGTELQDIVNGDAEALAMFETIRTHGAVCMGLVKSIEKVAACQHTSKVALVAPPKDYVASSDKKVGVSDVDLLARALSMGRLHHTMMGTAAVAIDTTAATPGTLINLAAGGGKRGAVRFGHPSGMLCVGAETKFVDDEWTVTKAIMSRSACVLMEGRVHVPG